MAIAIPLEKKGYYIIGNKKILNNRGLHKHLQRNLKTFFTSNTTYKKNYNKTKITKYKQIIIHLNNIYIPEELENKKIEILLKEQNLPIPYTKKQELIINLNMILLNKKIRELKKYDQLDKKTKKQIETYIKQTQQKIINQKN